MAYIIPTVSAGDDWLPGAATHNRLAEVANAFRIVDQLSAPAAGAHRSSGIVFVKNNSGAAVPCGGVLGIDTPAFTPALSSGDPTATEQLNVFLGEVILLGVSPTAAHRGKFVVTLQPIPAGEIGQAMVSGVAPAKVNVASVADRFAFAAAGVTEKLTSGDSGAAQILWKQVAGAGTGDQWAVIRLGNEPTDAMVGEFQHMVYMNVTQNTAGFDFVQAHALP